MTTWKRWKWVERQWTVWWRASMTKIYSRWTSTLWLTPTRWTKRTLSWTQTMSILMMKMMIISKSNKKWMLLGPTRANPRRGNNRLRGKSSVSRSTTQMVKIQQWVTNLLKMSKADQSRSLGREMAQAHWKDRESCQLIDNVVVLEFHKLGLRQLMGWNRSLLSRTTRVVLDTRTQ